MDKKDTTGWIRELGCDPITFSVMLSRLNGIVEEMTHTLEQSAWTSVLSLCRDFSCALYDSVPRQIAMADALPVHTTSLHLLIAEIQKAFAGDINDGDVFLCNDPYRFNTHVGDLVAATPVFVDGRHAFWSVAKGHQMDVGAFVPSSVTAAAQNVWQEGLIIPPLKLYDRGKPRNDMIELYLSNLRYRDLMLGDLMAELGSIEKGRRRLIELCQDYGAVEVERYVDAMIVYAERRMKEEIRGMPEGTWHAEGWIDSDGFDVVDIPIHVSVTIADGRISVDYAGSGPQAKGGVNGSIATTLAAGTAPFLYYVDPDIPHNQGVIDCISVTAPKGSICNPNYPASTSCATVVPSNLMSDVVNKAMAQAMPDKVLAGLPRSASVPQFSGESGWDGKPWGVLVLNGRGGMGSASDIDGWPQFGSHGGFGGLRLQSVEQMELLYPIELEQAEIEPDSMGFGRHIGGPGVRMSVRPVLGAVNCITFGDGMRNPPHGLGGGTRGIGGGQYVEDVDTGIRRFASAAANLDIAGNERYVGVSTGGGGHGDPLQRDPEQVRKDVRDGMVGREAAYRIFRVALDGSFDPKILAEETAALRREAKPADPTRIDPPGPNANTWLDGIMTERDVFLLNPA